VGGARFIVVTFLALAVIPGAALYRYVVLAFATGESIAPLHLAQVLVTLFCGAKIFGELNHALEIFHSCFVFSANEISLIVTYVQWVGK